MLQVKDHGQSLHSLAAKHVRLCKRRDTFMWDLTWGSDSGTNQFLQCPRAISRWYSFGPRAISAAETF